MMPNIGAPELLIILLIAVFLFGASRLPKVARGLGQVVHELRRATADTVQDAPAPRAASSSTITSSDDD